MKRAWGEVTIEFGVEVMVDESANLKKCEAAILAEAKRQAGNLSTDIVYWNLTDVEDGIQDD